MVTRRTALGLAVVAIAVAACQVIAGIEEVEKVPLATETEGGTSGSNGSTSSSGIDPADPCQHSVIPEKPTDLLEDGEDKPTYFIAMRELNLVKPPPNNILGFDLDGTCTCDTRPGPRRHDGGSSCKPRKSITCDPDGGIDNQGSSLFAEFEKQLNLLSGGGETYSLDTESKQDIAEGKRTIVMFLKGWNGKPDDRNVKISLFVSNSGITKPPAWDGNDVWSHPSSLKDTGGGALEPLAANNGYVRKGRLIASTVGDIKVLFGGSGLTFNGAFVAGDLAYDPAHPEVPTFAGIVGGRIPDEDLIKGAAKIKAGSFGRVCNLDAVFKSQVVVPICNAVDIARVADDDKLGTAPCNAISASISMVGMGAVVPLAAVDDGSPPEPDGCPADTPTKCD